MRNHEPMSIKKCDGNPIKQQPISYLLEGALPLPVPPVPPLSPLVPVPPVLPALCCCQAMPIMCKSC